MSAEHLLLELEQLDHQTGQGLVGGRLGLDVLGVKQRERIRAQTHRNSFLEIISQDFLAHFQWLQYNRELVHY